MFIPNAILSETIAIIEDYDNETIIYKPEIRQAKLNSKPDGRAPSNLPFAKTAYG